MRRDKSAAKMYFLCSISLLASARVLPATAPIISAHCFGLIFQNESDRALAIALSSGDDGLDMTERRHDGRYARRARQSPRLGAIRRLLLRNRSLGNE